MLILATLYFPSFSAYSSQNWERILTYDLSFTIIPTQEKVLLKKYL